MADNLPPGFTIDQGPATASGPPPGFTIDQPSRHLDYGDIAKSYPMGVVEGALANPAADISSGIGSIVRQPFEWAARKYGEAFPDQQKYVDAAMEGARAATGATGVTPMGPTSELIHRGVQGVTGPWYQSKTPEGKIARSIGQFTPAALMPESGTVPARILQTVAGGTASEIAGEATEGTALEPWARLGAGAVGIGAGHYLAQPRAPARTGPAVDMDALEREITRPQGRNGDISTDGGRTWFRLLPPDAPHNGRGSLGAAATGLDPLADYTPKQIEAGRKILAESGLDNPQMLEQQLDQISDHHFMGELTPGTEEHLGGIYAADQGQAKNQIAQTINTRASEAPARVHALFERTIGPAQNPARWTREIEADRARQSEPAWRQYAETSIQPTPALEGLLRRIEPTGALRAADRAMAIEGLPADGTFANYRNGQPGWPSAVAWQYAKEHLDSLIERALAEPGGANEARRLTQLKNELVGAIDNHPADDVRGVWQMARRLWQEPSELLESFKIGQRLLTNNIHRDDLPFITDGWSDQRFAAARAGLRSYLNDLEVNNRSAARTTNRLMDAILSEGSQQKLRFMLHDRNAEELFDGLRHEETMHGAPSRIMYGSPTARRQASRDLYSAAPSQIGQNLSRIAGYLKHPFRQAAAEGVEAVSTRATAQAEAQAAELREGLARMFTTQGAQGRATMRALVGAEEQAPAWGHPGPGAPPRGASPAPPAPRTPGPGPAPSGSPRGPANPSRGPGPGAAPAPSVPPIDLRRPVPLGPAPAAAAYDDLTAAARVEAAPRIVQMAMHGATDADIAGATGLAEEQVRFVRERLGIAETRPADAVGEHFSRAPAPDDNMTGRVVDLTQNHGYSPAEAHERSALERIDAGQNEGLPSLSRQARGNLSHASERPSAHGVEAGATEGQPRSAVPGEASPVPGEAHPEEAQRGNGPHQGPVASSDFEAMAARIAARANATGGLSNWEAMRASQIAEMRAKQQARAAGREAETGQTEASSRPELPAEEPSRLQFKSQAAMLDKEQALRRASEHEPAPREFTEEEQAAQRRQWEGLRDNTVPTRPPNVLPSADFAERMGWRPRKNETPDETLKREVIERGRSGRPTRTEPLPTDKENAILEEGARRISGDVEEPPQQRQVKPRNFFGRDEKGAEGPGLRLIRQMHSEGMSVNQIARTLRGMDIEIAAPNVFKVMKRYGLERNNPAPGFEPSAENVQKLLAQRGSIMDMVSGERYEQIINGRNEGKNAAAIATELGLSKSRVQKVFDYDDNMLQAFEKEGGDTDAVPAHFNRAPAPDDNMRNRVADLAENHDYSAAAAYERATLERTRRIPRVWTDEKLGRLKEMLLAGDKSHEEIAQELGTSRGRISRLRNEMGLEARPRNEQVRSEGVWTQDAVAKLQSLRAEGKSFAAIAVALKPDVPDITRGKVAGKLARMDPRGGNAASEFSEQRTASAKIGNASRSQPGLPKVRLPEIEPGEFTEAELAQFQKMLGYKRGGRVPGELPAAQKSSHEEVGYVAESPRKKQHCDFCTKFIPAVEGGPACKKVVSPIAFRGWCWRFVRASEETVHANLPPRRPRSNENHRSQ